MIIPTMSKPTTYIPAELPQVSIPFLDDYKQLSILSSISAGLMGVSLGMILYHTYYAYKAHKNLPSENHTQSINRTLPQYNFGSLDPFGYRKKYNGHISNVIGDSMALIFSSSAFCLSHFYDKKALPIVLLISNASSLILLPVIINIALDVKHNIPERG